MEYSWLKLLLSCNLCVYFSNLLTYLFIQYQIVLFWSSATKCFKHFSYKIFQSTCWNFRISFLYLTLDVLLLGWWISSFNIFHSLYIVRFWLFKSQRFDEVIRWPAFILELITLRFTSIFRKNLLIFILLFYGLNTLSLHFNGLNLIIYI